MLRRPHYIVLSLVLLLALVLLNLPEQASVRLKLVAGGLFAPFFGLTTSAERGISTAAVSVVPRRVLAAENEKLRQENQQLLTQRVQLEELGRENDRLRQQLYWQRQTRWRMRLAHVVGRDPSNWWKTIQIDLGSRDGVTVNQTVMTPYGLVGRVSAVAYSRSQVLLVSDPNCRVAALVLETRDNGVVMPASGVLDPSMVVLTYLSRNTQLQPDQTVVTSELSGIFPKGILIGKVIDSRTVGYGLYTEARVKLAIDLNKLEEVWVVWR